jgi:5-methylphenazine-1-carboxylate 1-monooxygenase
MEIVIIGAGIGGLTTALELHRYGIAGRVRIVEAASTFLPLGVGITLRPHCVKELAKLGLLDELAKRTVMTKEHAFFTHHGQLVYSEPSGIAAGYDFPNFSAHRGDLHSVLLNAVNERLGPDTVVLAQRCVGVEQGDGAVTVHVNEAGRNLPREWRAEIVIAADGIHSPVRKTFYPGEGSPAYHGINMWRGVTKAKPFLTGASSTRIGGLFTTNKLLVYPIRNNIDGAGTQLINWVAEVVTDVNNPADWHRQGRLQDFYPIYQNWTFDWLDCAALLRNAEMILEYPMVDRDPVDGWSFGRIALLGDAAHPMYPRGGNGGAQAILDAEAIARHLAGNDNPVDALKAYEAERLPKVNPIVLENRVRPPDVIIDTVERLTGGKRFDNLDAYISQAELREMSENYKRVAAYDLRSVNG